MATWEPDEIDFEDQYDKADPIDNANLDKSINELNESIREQEELEKRIRRAEWTSTNKDERTKLEQQIVFNEKKQGLYIMRASKTIISILHRGFDKIKQDGRVMVLDEKSAEKLYNRLHLVESDERTYKIAFENESGTYDTPYNGSKLNGTATSGLEGRVPELQIKLLTQLQKAFCFLLFWILSRLFP